MNLRLWRRPQPPRYELSPKAEIAVLEYDLYGIQPEPGTVAAAIVGLRVLPQLSPGPQDLSVRELS